MNNQNVLLIFISFGCLVFVRWFIFVHTSLVCYEFNCTSDVCSFILSLPFERSSCTLSFFIQSARQHRPRFYSSITFFKTSSSHSCFSFSFLSFSFFSLTHWMLLLLLLFLMIHWWYSCFFLFLFKRTPYHNFRSVPLKSQLNTYTEKGKIPVLDFLSTALESVEYERALTRGLVSIASLLFVITFFLLLLTNFSTYIYNVV